MIRFLTLVSFTEQGIRAIDKSCERAETFRADVEAAGGKVNAIYWAIGEFDGAVVFDVPDEATATRILCSLAKLGNVRTKSLRAFDEAESRAAMRQ